MTLAVILTLMIGVSRLYLGVHWPSDVLAGWTLGSACALLFWVAARKFEPITAADRPSAEKMRKF